MSSDRGALDLELFPCSGGMAEGFRRAGVVFDLAFDVDPDACESYGRNLGHRPIRMDVRDILRMVRTGWRPAGGVRLLVADPPCTPWSKAGKRRGTADERDMLRDTAELVALLRPAAYLIGNVPGLDDATNAHVVADVIGGLGKHGYCTADFVSLDAADYGVPQHRVRPFWYGHQRGPCVRWPTPTHGDPREVLAPHLPGVEALAPWRTCRDALQHLPPQDLGRPVRLRPKYGNGKYWSEADAPALTVTAHESARGGHWLKTHPKHPINRPDAPSYAVTTKGGGRGAQGAACLEWPWDRPATTIPRLASPGHHDEHRTDRFGPDAVILSERAAAILQGFPEGWRFCGRTKESRWAQIGMAMPPALAEAVARSVVDQLARPS